jgi:hypothetical protein
MNSSAEGSSFRMSIEGLFSSLYVVRRMAIGSSVVGGLEVELMTESMISPLSRNK